MRNNSSLCVWLGGLLSLVIVCSSVHVDAAPRGKKNRSKKAAVSPLVDLDGILEKDSEKAEEKVRPRAMGNSWILGNWVRWLTLNWMRKSR